MRLISCGAADGKLVVYFHGAPGAPEECLLFDQQGQADGLTFVSLDRLIDFLGTELQVLQYECAISIIVCARHMPGAR